jgi:hypothetical protein
MALSQVGVARLEARLRPNTRDWSPVASAWTCSARHGPCGSAMWANGSPSRCPNPPSGPVGGRPTPPPTRPTASPWTSRSTWAASARGGSGRTPARLARVVVAELDSPAEPLGHHHLVGRLTLAFANLDPELPGCQGPDADVCHDRTFRAVPWPIRGWHTGAVDGRENAQRFPVVVWDDRDGTGFWHRCYGNPCVGAEVAAAWHLVPPSSVCASLA